MCGQCLFSTQCSLQALPAPDSTLPSLASVCTCRYDAGQALGVSAVQLGLSFLLPCSQWLAVTHHDAGHSCDARLFSLAGSGRGGQKYRAATGQPGSLHTPAAQDKDW